MATITLHGDATDTIGDLPGVGAKAPTFTLTKTDLSECRLQEYEGGTLVLNIFPSIDTDVCAASVRRFNKEAGKMSDTAVLCVSADLPFAQGRFCGAEGLDNVVPVSTFRSPSFGMDYGVAITTGPLAGLLARAIVIIAPSGKVTYTEQVPEITEEPDYAAALEALG